MSGQSALGALGAGLGPRSLAGSGFRLGSRSSGIGPPQGRGPSLKEGRGSGAGPPASLSRPCAFSVLRFRPSSSSRVTADLEPVGLGLLADGMGNRGAARMRDFSFWILLRFFPGPSLEGQGSDFVKCRNDCDLSSALHALREGRVPKPLQAPPPTPLSPCRRGAGSLLRRLRALGGGPRVAGAASLPAKEALGQARSGWGPGRVGRGGGRGAVRTEGWLLTKKLNHQRNH